ncbi:50S ribosomal protein L7ae [Clostridium oceanicum]|uniref:Lipoprotein n=1 Tax=Clostridium oceanicum TaxID=1543 RepID=A0ABP3UK66_9CLOT
MISKKKMLIFISLIISISMLIGCNNTMDNIYNDNSKIVKEGDTFGLDETHEVAKNGIYKGIVKLSGTGTIWTYKSDKNLNLKVPYTFSVKSGKAKIVLISPNNKVTVLAENTGKNTEGEIKKLTIPIKKGNNRIKLVGYKKANITLEIHIDKGEFQKIDF